MTTKSKAERKNALAEILAVKPSPAVVSPAVVPETLAERKIIKLADLKSLVTIPKRTPTSKELFKDPFATNTYYENALVAFYKALEGRKTSKKNLVLTELLTRVNKGEEKIKIVLKDLLKFSSYADERFPKYFLDLAELSLDYRIVKDEKITRPTPADREGGGTIKDALIEFSIEKIPEVKTA